MDKILAVKKKKEFSSLPDSLVVLALDKSKGEVKEARAFLRKYFGVFLTNKVLKGNDESVLKAHLSTKGRDYSYLYEQLFSGVSGPWSVLDLGSGVNGFSFSFMQTHGVKNYKGVEASGQLVEATNTFFKDKGYLGKVYCEDILNFSFLDTLFPNIEGKKMIFLWLVVDALEGIKDNASKELLEYIQLHMAPDDRFVLSFSLQSLSGKSKFNVNRQWLLNFLEGRFSIEKDFVVAGERVLRLRKT